MSNITELLDSMELKQKESKRLLDTLKYYNWLEEHGTSWDQIKGHRNLKRYDAFGHPQMSEYMRMSPEIRARYPRRTLRDLIDYKLSDGSLLVLPWPPFDDRVICNKKWCD